MGNDNKKWSDYYSIDLVYYALVVVLVIILSLVFL